METIRSLSWLDHAHIRPVHKDDQDTIRSLIMAQSCSYYSYQASVMKTIRTPSGAYHGWIMLIAGQSNDLLIDLVMIVRS